MARCVYARVSLWRLATRLPCNGDGQTQPYPQDQLKSQIPRNFGTYRSYEQPTPFYPLPIVNNYYRTNFQLERLFNQPLAK